ncbi:ABC transporter ATP-binding protein [Mesorhizobium hungaricum]|jgi:branched-chain amino acid transport system ATP-binding protein|uniref:ABC transporter ATP-binding protein n=1 Tax=Mesorhizobium hungaricum TaxID=1566387 RepID=A0A1C2E381_9HYPH|nr:MULTISPECIES: ABC transporter ATP-binding protein [Mesorhizobium]MBN9235808.1 ABC transporter ATP-binding protein [Mesorhizobium sp.]OCX21470.1 ABC transporter ATP-binding protein [Mesorhizobium hungaricum]
MGSDRQELRANAVTVSFGGVKALQSVDLSVSTGEILGLIGPNGAGKTTLVNCLTGFQRPALGQITLNGENASAWNAVDFRRRGITRTFQGGRLFADMTVLENVEVPLVASGLSRRVARREASELLKRLGIAGIAHNLASALPYTDERRVGIARALAGPRNFVLLDEPAAGMSDVECEELMQVVQTLPANFGCGVILIEHNMTVVLKVSHKIHVLDGGRTLAEGTPQAIRTNAAVIEAYLGAEV